MRTQYNHYRALYTEFTFAVECVNIVGQSWDHLPHVSALMTKLLSFTVDFSAVWRLACYDSPVMNRPLLGMQAEKEMSISSGFFYDHLCFEKLVFPL